ncbi:heterokaryon incompatibility protein-domain-containing protein [Durotheca rogersii]|uniref:heterokaryon incompatibility protein-domain-containing protein n=1 Tax=Durotheca rogersii TaxID=419775 RepID=UPI002220C482|nr:heterokaryon incompatibility protein-domain-containing protein [Durotheca rogersii]KAI5867093.1 heterokaryon incompatibility protein-domain-containing protein [Durotheca rogersii]
MSSEDATSHRNPVPWVEETATPFRYNPLGEDEVRLLELEPSSSPEDPIRCKIIHASCRGDHKYDILSCDWSSSSEAPVPISLNGQTFDAPSEVWVALQRVRLETQPRLLWTDAICIDQGFDDRGHPADNPERRLQVSRLKATYQGAEGVLVWLGSAADDSHLVFEHLERCSGHTHLNWCHYKGAAAAAYERLCARPWFYRPFAAAELALSQRPAVLLCGRHRSEWPHPTRCSSFPATADYYHPPAAAGPDGRTHLHHLRQVARGGRVQLRSAVLWMRHCRAADPRDKVLGLLLLDTGLALDGPAAAALDVADLFARFTRAAIEASRNLEVLHWFGVPPASAAPAAGRPSWVPDCGATDPVGTLPRVFGAAASYSVHYPLALLPGFGFRPGGVLAARGYFVATIASVADALGGPSASSSSSEAIAAGLRGWESAVAAAASASASARPAEATAAAFRDTLAADDEADLQVESDAAPHSKKVRPPTSRWAEPFAAWYRRHGAGALLPPAADGGARAEREDALASRFARRAEAVCYGRRLFFTAGDGGGSMGLAPPHARPGDRVAFLPGGRYPFVVRARPDGTYELLGDCFLYDLDVFALRLEAQETEIRLA